VKQIYNMTSQLIESVKQSEYYEDYQDCMKSLRQKQDIYGQFNEFRKKYYELIYNGQENFEEIEKLQQEFHAVLGDADVIRFMEAEDRICVVMKEIYTMIAEQLDFDMDFMDDLSGIF
jgi:cell fate (sporulation/competence/biofilm development) regulator YlbF (YheA/YmcA/DUF963 family)